MKRVLFTLFGLVVIAVAAVLVLPLFLSAEDVRNRLFTEVESATGYRLRVDGPLNISVFPSLGLVARDVGVSQVADGVYQELATAEELRFGLSLGSLIGGNVRMTEILLSEPVIRLPKQTEATGQGTGEQTAGGLSGPGRTMQRLSLDRLTIENGTVLNPETGMTVSALNLTASLPSYDAPLSLTLAADIDGTPLELSGAIGGFGSFLEGTAQSVSLDVEAPAQLAQAISLEGTAQYTGESVRLDPFSVKAGDSAFGGTLAADLSGETPTITASLKGDLIDIDSLMTSASDAKSNGTAGGSDTGMDQPIDFSALSALAAKLDLSVSRIIVSGIAVEPLVGALSLGGGRADLTADLIGVGGATGAASVSVDATKASPYISGSARIKGVDLKEAGSLAGAALPVSGVADADLIFATAGSTPAELQGRINASGSLSLRDGSATIPELVEAIGDSAAGTVSAINLTARFKDLVSPVSVSGSATWRGDRFDLSTTADVRGILAGQSSAVDVKASSQRVSAGFDGKVSASGSAAGRVSLSTPSLTGLLRWLGQEPGWQSGFEAFSVAGNLSASETAVSFKDASIRLDDTKGTGSGSVTLGGVPTIEARLDLETLNVNPYLGAAGQTSSAPSGGGGTAGWDTAPIDFSALKAINADLGLSVKKLIYQDIKAGPVAIAAKIKGGKLTTELSDLKLYGGSGKGSLNVDASGKVPTQAISFSLKGLDAYPFLTDAAGFRRIEGTANIALDVTASGASQKAIVSALDGTAGFAFSNGAIRGVNIAKMVRNLTTNTLSGWQSGETEKTDFAKLGADFKIESGLASTKDLQLVGPLVRISGSGSADMPAQTLDFRVDPKVVASLEGQGSKKELEGLGVPVVIAGPWARPRIYPDIAGILENPQAAYEQLQKLGGGLFNLEGGDALSGAIGGIDSQVKDATGLSINDLVKDGTVDQEALQQGAIKGLQNLLGGSDGGQPAGNQPKPDKSKDKANKDKKSDKDRKQAKTDKKAQQDQTGTVDLEDTANQLLKGLFGN